MAALATLVGIGSLAASPAHAAAASKKVVIVVGPTHSATSNYIYNAKLLARQARAFGATVKEIYSPNATWYRVRTYARGANLLIYLGHGNGFPNPYSSTLSPTKVDGMGLNAAAGHGNANTKYYGEYYFRNYVRLAPNAVVILNRLCYASGNSEPGRANPTKTVAKRRVDNFGAGFLRTGAKAVFAYGTANAKYIVADLFRSNKTMSEIFWSDPSRVRTYSIAFSSSRTSGMKAIMDPYRPSRYYRSVVGKLYMTAAAWR